MEELRPSPARLAKLRRLAWAGVGAALVTISLYSWFFFQTGAWQFLLPVGGLILSLLYLLPFFASLRKANIDAAGVWLMVPILLAFAIPELALKGMTVASLAGGSLVIYFLGTHIWPAAGQKGWRWVWALSIYVALLAAINFLQPLPRYDISALIGLQMYVVSISVVLVLAILVPIIASAYQRSIRTRLQAAFGLVVLLAVLVTTLASFITGSLYARDQALTRLDSIASLKETFLNDWLKYLSDGLSNPFTSAELTSLEADLLNPSSGNPENTSQASARLQDSLLAALKRNSFFEELFVLDPAGKVVLSTNPAQVGQAYAGQVVFERGLLGRYVSSPFFDPSLKKYSLLSLQPLRNPNGVKIGVLAGRANMQKFEDIFLARQGLGNTGETYLVSAERVLLTPAHNAKPGALVQSRGMDAALKSLSRGSASYTTPWGERIFGVYHWLPEFESVLLAEQGQAEVLGAQWLTLLFIIGLSLVVLLASMFIGLKINNTIASPIADLARTSARVAAGELNLRVPVARLDELGELARSFNDMTAQLRDTVSGLEQRVTERTRDLQRRTAQLKAAAEISRDITTTTDLEDLLNQAVELVRDRFGFYHAGIFLLDEREEWAVLRAATGEAGQEMLRRSHRLKVGEVGIVGYTTGTGRPRIALDVGADAAFFKNPLLPQTRSEMALPLRAGKQVIGALDVQSSAPAAFTEEDVTVLQTMADQLAVAIENARLITRMNQTVKELEAAYGHYTHETWHRFSRDSQRASGYRFQQLGIWPVSEQNPEASEALSIGQTVVKSDLDGPADELEGPVSAIAVPIRLREQVIGVLNLRFKGETINTDTHLLVEEAAARLALVLENARLLQEAQRLALREQQINVLSTQVRSSTNIDAILQNTVRELGKALGASRTFIQINPVTGPLADPLPAGGNGHKEPEL